MHADEILNRVRETLRDTPMVRQVFGEPYERDGALIVPVARVGGGGGGGGGTGESPEPGGSGSGGGGGLGFVAHPVGVYVIRGGEVSWQPAVDVTRIVLQGQMVGIVALLVLRSVVRRLRRRR